jgi:hypothetical protein
MPSSTPKSPARFVEEIGEALARHKSASGLCCARDCLRVLATPELDAHLVDVHHARSLGFRSWWFWVRSLYFNLLPVVTDRKTKKTRRAQRVSVFRLPAVTLPLCRTAFRTLLGISHDTLQKHTAPRSDTPTSATPSHHSNHGSTPAHALSSAAVSAVVHFVHCLAEKEGVPNPRFTLDRTSEDQPDNLEHIVHLPSCYSRNRIFIKYTKSTEVEGARVGRSSFMEILKRDDRLANIKFSKRTLTTE